MSIFYLVCCLCCFASALYMLVNDKFISTFSLLFFAIIFLGLYSSKNDEEVTDVVAKYYNLSEGEVRNVKKVSEKTFYILLEKIPEIEAEKVIQRNKEKIIR